MRTLVILKYLLLACAIGCNSKSNTTAVDPTNTTSADVQTAKLVPTEIEAGMQADEFERSRKLQQKAAEQMEPLEK